MDDLSLELEALQAIYSDKELTIETRENCKIIHIQLIKEATTNDTTPPGDGDNEVTLPFVKIKVEFLISQDYPDKSPPEINSISVCILNGRYRADECPIDNDYSAESDSNAAITLDDSTSRPVYLNVDEIVNYYNSIKTSYIGRVCLFDAIENLQAFVDDNTHKYTSNQNFQNPDSKPNSEEEKEEEVVYSGLTERLLCPVDERVTEEQFNLWKTAFRTEMIEKNIWKDETQDSSQLTGKQLFEKDETLVRSDDHVSLLSL